MRQGYLFSVAMTTLLPPANEVWRKVMFLHASTILVHRGEGVCLRRGVYYIQGLSRSPRSTSRRICVWGVGRRPPYSKSGRYASYWNAFLFTMRCVRKRDDISDESRISERRMSTYFSTKLHDNE